MPTQISKVEFETLPESLKGKFTADGDAYTLQEEDVTGLKTKKDELLAEVKALKTKFDGLDPDVAKQALAKLEEIEADKLTKKGDWETLKTQLEERHASELNKIKGDHESLLANLKREKLTNVLTEKGVLPDRAKYLVHELDAQIELESGDNGFSLKKKGGIGDAVEFNGLIESVKQTSPFFFASSSASGSGASPSNGTSSSAKQWTRTQWDGASTQERTAFTEGGGKITST